MEIVMNLLWNVLAVFSIAFTVTYGVSRLSQWIDERDERRRLHAHRMRDWER